MPSNTTILGFDPSMLKQYQISWGSIINKYTQKYPLGSEIPTSAFNVSNNDSSYYSNNINNIINNTDGFIPITNYKFEYWINDYNSIYITDNRLFILGFYPFDNLIKKERNYGQLSNLVPSNPQIINTGNQVFILGNNKVIKIDLETGDLTDNFITESNIYLQIFDQTEKYLFFMSYNGYYRYSIETDTLDQKVTIGGSDHYYYYNFYSHSIQRMFYPVYFIDEDNIEHNYLVWIDNYQQYFMKINVETNEFTKEFNEFFVQNDINTDNYFSFSRQTYNKDFSGLLFFNHTTGKHIYYDFQNNNLSIYTLNNQATDFDVQSISYFYHNNTYYQVIQGDQSHKYLIDRNQITLNNNTIDQIQMSGSRIIQTLGTFWWYYNNSYSIFAANSYLMFLNPTDNNFYYFHQADAINTVNYQQYMKFFTNDDTDIDITNIPITTITINSGTGFYGKYFVTIKQDSSHYSYNLYDFFDVINGTITNQNDNGSQVSYNKCPNFSPQYTAYELYDSNYSYNRDYYYHYFNRFYLNISKYVFVSEDVYNQDNIKITDFSILFNTPIIQNQNNYINTDIDNNQYHTENNLYLQVQKFDTNNSPIQELYFNNQNQRLIQQIGNLDLNEGDTQLIPNQGILINYKNLNNI